MTEPVLETKKVRRPSKRSLWFGARTILLLLGLPLLFLVIGVLMMFDRDITAPSWVRNAVEDRAVELLAGGSIDFGEISVRVGRDLHPTVSLTNTQLWDAQGALLANVSEMSGLLSPRGFVLEQSALIQELTVSGAAVSLKRNEDGSLAFAFDRQSQIVNTAPDLSGLVAQFDAFFERPALVALEQVTFENVGVDFEDARAQQAWQLEDGRIRLDLRGDLTRASAALAVRQPDRSDALIDLGMSRNRVSGGTDLNASIRNAVSGDIALQAPELSWLKAVDAPVSVEVTASMADTGSLGIIRSRVILDAGVLRPTPSSEPLAFDEARIDLRYDPTNQSIEFDDVRVVSAWGGLTASGQALLGDTSTGLPEDIVTQLKLSEVVLNPPDFFDEPHVIDTVHADFRLTLDPFQVDIGQIHFDDADLPLEGNGRIKAGSDGWDLAFDFAIPEIEQETLIKWWPNGLKPRARTWLVDQINGGVISDLAGGVRAQQGMPFRYGLGFDFQGVDVKFMRSMPPLSGGDGYASFADNSFALSLSKGTLVAPKGGVLDFAGSELWIPDLRVKNGPMEMELAFESSITATLATLDLKPFEFMQKASMAVDQVDGISNVDGWLRFPIKGKITPEEVDFRFSADLRRVASDQLIPGQTLTASSLQVSVDRSGVEISGPASVGGVPLNGTFEQTFGPDASRRLFGTMEVSDRFFDTFKIALPPGSVSGRGSADFDINLPDGSAPEFELRSNLEGMRLAIPPLGWSKAASTTGGLLVQGAFAKPTRIDRIEVSGGGLSAIGAVRLRADGSLDQARFSQVRLADWLNAPITLRGRGAGQPVAVELGGGVLDLRQARLGGDQRDGGPMQVRLDRLQVTEGIALTGFSGTFDGSGGFSGDFRGQVNGQAAIRGSVVPQNRRSAVRIQSDDAGGAVAAAGFLRNGIGGSLDLTLLPANAAGSFDGTLAIRGLRVRDAPSIAALLNAVSVVGLLQQLDGQGLAFDEVDAQFRLSPTQVVVTQSSAVGPGLGISLDGVYTLASKTVDFQGVISPIYLLNGIGSVLTRKGEGLIGFNFNLRGDVAQPDVLVNPLSALTPGMFREIFRRPAPQVSQ